MVRTPSFMDGWSDPARVDTSPATSASGSVWEELSRGLSMRDSGCSTGLAVHEGFRTGPLNGSSVGAETGHMIRLHKSTSCESRFLRNQAAGSAKHFKPIA